MQQAFNLVAISHLRWEWVWQRPQHVVSRMAAAARTTLFVEEPVIQRSGDEGLWEADAPPVRRVAARVTADAAHLGFDALEGTEHEDRLAGACAAVSPDVVWLYTPFGLSLAERLAPEVLIYDVMDDLSAFRFAPEAMRLRHAQALAQADLVFTGGHTLHRRVLSHRRRPERTYCFPSGVEPEHFRHPKVAHDAPVAGYVGVIDERLDLRLLAELADQLPDWRIRMVGPVIKVADRDLPRRPNIEYLGHRPYAELPALMAGFDVALMPFARNEATASISPTKTLEYLAAGLPVVSTRVDDVVHDVGDCIVFGDDAAAFADHCRALLSGSIQPNRRRIRTLLDERRWDAIAATMLQLLDGMRTARDADSASA